MDGRFPITASTNGRGRVIAGSGRPVTEAGRRPPGWSSPTLLQQQPHKTNVSHQPAKYRARPCRVRIACIAAPAKKNKQLCAAGCMSQKKLGTSEGPVPSPGCMQAPGRCRSPLQPPSSRPAQPSQEPPPPPTMSTTTAEPGAGTRHARRAPSQGPSPPPTRRQKTWISWVTAALIARCFLHFPFNRPPVPPSLSSSLLFSSCSSSFLHFDLLNHHSSSMVCCC